MPDFFFRSNLYLVGDAEQLLFRTNTYEAVESYAVTVGATIAGTGLGLTSEPGGIATGDIIRWSNPLGGTLDQIVVYDDTSIKAASNILGFDFEVNDGSGYATAGHVSFQPVIDTGGEDPGSSNTIISVSSNKSILVR